VPLGTWIGGRHGWQAAFWFVAGIGVLVLIGMIFLLPPLPAGDDATLSARLKPLTKGSILRGLSCMLLVSAGGMMMMTYIAPVMYAAGRVTTDGIAVLFLAAGLAGVVATVIGGAGADRLGPIRMVILGASLLMASMLTLSAMVGWGATPLALLVVLAVVWSLAIGTLNPPLQVWLISRSGPAANEVMALNSSVTYLGTSAGGVIGGLLLAPWGPISLPLVAAAEVAIVVALLLTAPDRAVPAPADQPATAATGAA